MHQHHHWGGKGIDYILVSRKLAHLVKGVAARDDTAFATHSSVRIALSRQREDYLHLAPIPPKHLPEISKTVQQSDAAVALWKRIVCEDVSAWEDRQRCTDGDDT